MEQARAKWDGHTKKPKETKEKETIEGQARLNIAVGDVEVQERHQDGGIDGFSFLLMGDQELVNQQQRRKTLNPSYFYLDSMSSYNQAFEETYLERIQEQAVILLGKCNGGGLCLREGRCAGFVSHVACVPGDCKPLLHQHAGA